jgi:hypothetical protein
MENSSRKKNKGRRKPEAPYYWQASVRYEGKDYQILLTDNEVKKSIERARKNPEDVTTCSCGKKRKCNSLWCTIFGSGN